MSSQPDRITCYYCAEEILAAAKLCRYCNQPVSPANRIGLPGWYKWTGTRGLSLIWIQWDVETYALGTVGDVYCLRDPRYNPVDEAWSLGPDQEEWQRFRRMVSAIYRRLGEMAHQPGTDVERSFLTLLAEFYRIFNDLLNFEEMRECWAASNLRLLASSLRHRRDGPEMQNLPEGLREEFTQLYTQAIDTLEKYASKG